VHDVFRFQGLDNLVHSVLCIRDKVWLLESTGQSLQVRRIVSELLDFDPINIYIKQ